MPQSTHIDMKLVLLLKRLRNGLADFRDGLLGSWELLTGAVLALLMGRLAPTPVSGDDYRDALIICPSPLLNQQTIHQECRGKYVITFINSGCQSPSYLTLKPELYFLIDPAYFQAPEEVPGLVVQHDEDTVSIIADSTDWPMTLFVPWHYRNSPQAQRTASNPKIKVCGLPISSAWGHNRALKQFGFRLGILNPVYQNVLHAAIFYNLKAGRRRVFLWGAHNTWLKEVEVDEKNRVLHSVRHTEFQSQGIPLVNADGSPRRLHVYLSQLSITFEQYHVLEDFARREGKQIINATKESFIDAFERCPVLDLFSDRETAATDSK